MNQYPNRGAGGYYGGGQRQGGAPRPDSGQRPRTDDSANIDLAGITFGDELPADLFSDRADRAARDVSRASDRHNKVSQLRRFYDELVMWQEKVGNDDQKFKDCEPFIRMLKAKVAYATGRDHVDANFRALFERLIDQSKNAKTLRQAKLFFEAFMAYYKVYRKQ